MSWTPLEKRKARDEEEAMVTKVLRAHELVGPAIAADHARESSDSCDPNYKPLMALLNNRAEEEDS